MSKPENTRLTESMLKPELEKRYSRAEEEILAKLKERVANEQLTLEELVRLAVSEGYWTGAMDVTTLDVERLRKRLYTH
jgi:hypothetical protein